MVRRIIEHARQFWGAAGMVVRQSVHSLPVVVALALVTLVLEQHLEPFRAFDDGMLALVSAQMPVPSVQDDEAGVTVVMVTRPLFDSALGRSLPIDKERLAPLLNVLADKAPSVVGIDVDAVPVTGSPGPGAVQQLPLFEPVSAMLRQGTSVVLVSYPRPAKQSAQQARDWRIAWCEQAAGLHPEPGRSKGRLYWASTWLEPEGRALSVVRYSGPEQYPRMAAQDGGLLPLGLVMSVAARLAGSHQIQLAAAADYCALKPIPVEQTSAEGGKPPLAFINFFDKPLRVVEMTDPVDFARTDQGLEGRAVILGVSSFAGVDEHTTPLGRLPGAVLHALVAASVGATLRVDHHFAFFADVLFGWLFVLMFFCAVRVQSCVVKACPAVPTAAYVLNFGVGLCPLVLTVATILCLAPQLAVNGLWLNPLPLLVGLLVHLYIELSQPHHGAGTPSHGGSAGASALVRLHWAERGMRVLVWLGALGLLAGGLLALQH